MKNISLSVVALCALMTAAFAPALLARAQGSGGFDYMRLTPGLAGTTERLGYRACLATTNQWTCREFEGDDYDSGLRTALTSLGNERWELVSLIDETQNLSRPKGLTYVLKRQK